MTTNTHTATAMALTTTHTTNTAILYNAKFLWGSFDAFDGFQFASSQNIIRENFHL